MVTKSHTGTLRGTILLLVPIPTDGLTLGAFGVTD